MHNAPAALYDGRAANGKGDKTIMWKRLNRRKTAFLWMVVALAAVGTGCAPERESASADRSCYPVTRVVDGDTFKIDIGEAKDDTVRMLGVDTPETVKPGTPVQPYGKEASDYTKELLQNETVCLELDVQERDVYGRLLAYVYLRDGTFVNERLLREGYAQVLTIPPNVRFADRFLEVQQEARDAGRGLWGEPREAESGQTAGEAFVDRDCGDFTARAEAQSFFEAAGGPERDPHRLDSDGDGIACETLK